eukprot:5181586-Pyramimonas_sp.AAC.1
MSEACKPKGQEDDGNGKGKLLHTINPMPSIRVERVAKEKDEFEMDEDGNPESMKDGEGYQRDELDDYHPPYLKQAMGYTLKLLGGVYSASHGPKSDLERQVEKQLQASRS